MKREKEVVIRIEPQKKGFALQILDKDSGGYIVYHAEFDKISFESKVKKVSEEV
jgi:hypothetical protein